MPMVKTLPANVGGVGDAGSIREWEGPLEKEMATTAVFLPREPHRQRSLAGYSPQGCRELDTTEAI